ncbi:MAG: aspartate aminotransferase family protein, partial [Dehalococcoidia bacterium]
YLSRRPRSAALAERAARSLPSGVTHDSRHLLPFNVYIERAAGSRKWDIDGHEYVDYVMGHGALLLGHAHPAVVEAVATQASKGTHYGANHALEVEWAESVIELVPSAEAVRFTSSGTEATLMALRIARAATGRSTIVKFDRHFHGWHDYVVASSTYASRVPAGVPESTLASVVVIEPDLATVRETLAGNGDVAAVIVESAGAASGGVPLPRGFNAELARICRDRGVVFIMDEVVTGFRWSPGGVQGLEGVRPDLTALAKILAGGMPGGAVAGRRDLLDLLAFPSEEDDPKRDKIGHPGTFNANPVSAAAGVACLNQIGDGEAQRRADALAARLRAGMNEALHDLSIPGLVYGFSSVFRVLLGGEEVPEAEDPDPRQLLQGLGRPTMAPEAQRLLNLALLDHGVQFFGSGGMTSMVHTESDIERTVEAWAESLKEVRAAGVIG